MGHLKNFKEPVTFPEAKSNVFHGLAGRIVKLMEPCTEADPVAIYVQLLACIGNILGNRVRLMVGSKAMAMNLFVVIVGESARARKGTSLSDAMLILKQVEPEWAERNVINGLKTAEGLVHMVRDRENDPVREDGEVDVAEEHGPDPTDKRRLLVLSEFGGPLRLMRSAASSLPDVLRQAHDGDTLDVPTKARPERATNAHISLIGHITKAELHQLMNATSMQNGLYNRIQWYAVQRSKLLPFGVDPDPRKLQELLARLKAVIERAQTFGQMQLTKEAKSLYVSIYESLQNEDEDRTLDSLMIRGSGHILRVATLLAAIDLSQVVHEQHLQAALNLWDYSRQSARWAFTGGGESLHDQVLAFVLNSEKGYRTATEIRDSLCHRNPEKGRKVHEVLEQLRAKGLLSREQTSTGGRPAERWFAVDPKKAA